MKHLKQLTYLLISLVLLGCNTTKTPSTPTNVIGKDFTEKKEQLRRAINTFQNEEAVQILENMNQLEQKEALAWLPADESNSIQHTRIYYFLNQHNKNAPKEYRVLNSDSSETKQAFNILMKALKLDKPAIDNLYKNHDMDFFQGAIEKIAKGIKRGHKYNENEIFKMLESHNGVLRKYAINVRGYFPKESTLYENNVISSSNRMEEVKKEKAYKLKIAKMIPVKFYIIKRFKNNIVFHSFKTITNDKHLKSIKVDYKIKEQGKNQYYFFSYNIHNQKRGLEHAKIDCYLSDETKTYRNDFDEFKRIKFFRTGVIDLEPKKKESRNYYVVKIIKESSKVRFIKNNLEDLKIQIRQGKGAKLDALSKLYPVMDLSSWRMLLQKNYAKIFNHHQNNKYINTVDDIIFRLTIFSPTQYTDPYAPNSTVVPAEVIPI